MATKTNEITAGYYHVPATFTEFSDKHLKIHVDNFNPTRNPEYFTDFRHMGLNYSHTNLMHEDLVVPAPQEGTDPDMLQQLYRPGKNKKYNSIKNSIITTGFDLREKSISVVTDKNGKVLWVFSGNTTHDILGVTNLKNRIVSFFTKNENFSIANIIAIGAYMNSLEKEAALNDVTCVEHAVESIRKFGGSAWILGKDATQEEQQEYASKVKKYIAFMLQKDLDKITDKQTNRIINDLIDSQLTTKSCLSVKNGFDVIGYLSQNGYPNTKTVMYGSAGAFPSKIMNHFRCAFEKHSVLPLTDSEYFNFEKGHYELIIHMSSPEPTNPFHDFFDSYVKFWEEYKRIEKFSMNHYYTENPQGIDRFKIIGAFQQVEAISHIWPMGSVVDFDEIVNYYYENIKVQPSSLKAFIEVPAEVEPQASTDKQFGVTIAELEELV